MKTAVFASLIAGTAAFAPSKTAQSTTALSGAFDKEVRLVFCDLLPLCFLII